MENNVIKFMEALRLCRQELCDRCDNSKPCKLKCVHVGIIDRALALPLRNCDVGTAEEQAIRFDEFCQECEKCPLNEKRLNIKLVQCEFLWAQMPYAATERGGQNEGGGVTDGVQSAS